MSTHDVHPTPPDAGRKRTVDLLARCSLGDFETVWQDLDPKPDFIRLRGPETGLVMVRGRIGGGGAPFNLGETAVARATIQLSDGTVGHGYRLGTDTAAAQYGAVFDALWQAPPTRDFVERTLLSPTEKRQAAAADTLARETAATKVDFFTMVRGED